MLWSLIAGRWSYPAAPVMMAFLPARRPRGPSTSFTPFPPFTPFTPFTPFMPFTPLVCTCAMSARSIRSLGVEAYHVVARYGCEVAQIWIFPNPVKESLTSLSLSGFPDALADRCRRWMDGVVGISY